MAIYGQTVYGTDVYGLELPPAYLSDPFVATSKDYGSIRVTWNKPSGTIYQYRLLSNRYGFPVNENDGIVLMDSGAPQTDASAPLGYDIGSYFGSQYVDQTAVPGTYHYYGLYVLVGMPNTWVRSGVTCCLATANFGSAGEMLNLVPEHFKTNSDGDLTTDAVGNSYLLQFLNVLGWGMDYLRTQYWAAANYMNNPIAMPINDLWNMAAELGLTFSPEVPAYTMRKAVNNATHVYRERGTLAGLRNEVVLRTSWDADVQVGRNFLLHDDQSQFLNNVAVYEPHTYYKTNDIIQVFWDSVNNVFVNPDKGRVPWLINGYYTLPSGVVAGYYYKSLQANNQFEINQPTLGSSNAYWSLVKDTNDIWHHMDNVMTGNPSSWEVLDPTNTNAIPNIATLTLGVGVSHPLIPATPATSLRINNTSGTTRNMLARSVSRRNIELGNITDGGFESGITLPGRHHMQPDWAPANWPQIFWEPGTAAMQPWWPTAPPLSWWGGPYHIPSYWTLNNCTMVRSTAQYFSGTHSALITPAGFLGSALHPPTPSTASSPWVQCPAGIAVTGSVTVLPSGAGSSGALSTSMTVSLQWFDAWGTEIGNPTNVTTFTPTVSTFTKYSTTSGTAPAGTCYAALLISYSNAEVTDLVYVDTATLAVTPYNVNTNYPPELTQAIEDGLPVPWVRTSQQWSATTRYSTNDIVLYNNQPFIALRTSTGAVPPMNNTPTPEWAPLSESQRIRVAVSSYTSQDLSNVADQAVAVNPFVEWYDKHGNFIARVFARQPGIPGTVGKPNALAFDSFTSKSVVVSSTTSGAVTLGPWQASFYSNTTLTGVPAVTETVATVGGWTSGASPATGIPKSGWSASYTCNFTPTNSGNYIFSAQCAGGGFRIIVNGVTVVDNWYAKKTTVVSNSATPTALVAGTAVNVIVQYYDVPVPGIPGPATNPTFVPHTPTNLRAYAWTGTSISVTWDAMALATSYQVRLTYHTPDSDDELEVFSGITSENYTISTGISPWQTYGVHVVAYGDYGRGPSEASIVQRSAA